MPFHMLYPDGTYVPKTINYRRKVLTHFDGVRDPEQAKVYDSFDQAWEEFGVIASILRVYCKLMPLDPTATYMDTLVSEEV